MLQKLKQEVYKANLMLPKYNLVTFTWGNVSMIDEDRKYVVIKPSGVDYENLNFDDMVVLDMDMNVIEGKLNPSSDTATHIEIYKAFPTINSVVHTHSRWATIFSQAKRSIIPYGTTHADYFYGEIPITRDMTSVEVELNYEKNTGLVIVDTFIKKDINPLHIPAVLVSSHGPFTFGVDANSAVHNAVVLEELAQMAYYTEKLTLKEEIKAINPFILDKHFNRKHGSNAYYGQK